MKFIDLYNRIIELWPEEIDISDGYPTGKSGFLFPNLSEVHNNVENQINHKIDHWGNIAVWTFLQVFHKKAKELLDADINNLMTREVDIKLIDDQIRSNLESEEWADERTQYIGL